MLRRRGLPRIQLFGRWHTDTTLLLAAEVTLSLLQEGLGHEDAAYLMDNRAHALPSEQQQAMPLFGALLETSKPKESEKGRVGQSFQSRGIATA